MMLEIRKPEMTKKTSTPTKPPWTVSGKAWNPTTVRTAIPRSPSMSGRYAGRTRLPSSCVERKICGSLWLIAAVRHAFRCVFYDDGYIQLKSAEFPAASVEA